jgi:hypothetical protein
MVTSVQKLLVSFRFHAAADKLGRDEDNQAE